MARIKPYSQECPIASTLDIIGDRWTILLLRDLAFGKRRFNELLRSSPGLPPKMLSVRLRKLEDYGIIERAILEGRPPRTEYVLTALGRSLGPVLQMIGQWGLENLYADRPAARAEIERMVFSRVPRLIPEDIRLKAADYEEVS